MLSEKYWEQRKHLRYYRVVIDLAKRFAPRAGSVIDVGAANTRVLDLTGPSFCTKRCESLHHSFGL